MNEPVWLTYARTFLGVKEGPGPVDNPVITRWASDLSIPWIEAFYQHDSIPWCGLFMAKVMHQNDYALPANPLGALNWRAWGSPLSKGAVGAVCVFLRDGGGHVALYLGEDAEFYYTLGGNQSDAVTATDKIPKAHLVALRWPPREAPPVGDNRVWLNGSSATEQAEA